MPKPKNNQNNKTGTVRTRIVRRGPSMTKKKDRLKKLDLESSQQTISQVEKPDEVDEETRRREREEDRRRWLQQQRIKYPVAPDGYIPNSIVRRNLQPHVPRPPEKQPEEKTKLTFLERRLSRLERMNSLDLLGASEFRFLDNASRASSPSLSAVDRDRPSSKKKARSDVVNDVVTQIRQTSPQLTSFLELEDIAEVEPRLEDSASTSTPEGSSSRERERGRDSRGKGGERVDEEGRGDIEEAGEKDRGGEDDGRKEEMESGGSGRLAPHIHHQQEVNPSPQQHHNSPSSSFFSSVAKQPLISGHQDQTSSAIHPTQENDDNESSSDLKKRRREEEGLDADHVTGIKDGENDVDAITVAAKDVGEEAEKEEEEERDVVGRGGDDGGDLDSYPPSNWKIPLIVEPEDDENETAEDEQTTREGGERKGEGGEEGGKVKGGGGVGSAAEELTSGKDAAVAAEHDGNFGAINETGSRSDGAPSGDEDEKRSSEVDTERENGTGGQRFDSKEEKEKDKEEEEQLVKVLVDISLPNVRQLDEEDSAADEATTKTANGGDKEKVGYPDRDLSLNGVREEKPEVDEDEYGGGRGRRRRRRMDGRGLNVEEWGDDGEPVSPFFSALRPPRLYDDDLDLTSFNSSMAATNASPPVFIELDESENGGEGDKEDGRGNFLNSRSTRNAKDFSSEMGNRGEREEKEEGEMEGEGQQGEENDNDRYWSSCSNGRLNRRHNHRSEDDHGSNPSPPLGWHLTWYDRYYQGQGEHPTNTGSSKADHRRGADGTEAGEDGFLPRLLQLSKDERKKRRHHGCEYSILVQRRMHEHISITRYLRTKKLAEILCDFRKPFNPNIIKFQYAV